MYQPKHERCVNQTFVTGAFKLKRQGVAGEWQQIVTMWIKKKIACSILFVFNLTALPAGEYLKHVI